MSFNSGRHGQQPIEGRPNPITGGTEANQASREYWQPTREHLRLAKTLGRKPGPFGYDIAVKNIYFDTEPQEDARRRMRKARATAEPPPSTEVTFMRSIRTVSIMLFVWHSKIFANYYARLLDKTSPATSRDFRIVLGNLSTRYKDVKHKFYWKYAYPWVIKLAGEHPGLVQLAARSDNDALLRTALLYRLNVTAFQDIFYHVKNTIDYEGTKARPDQRGYSFIQEIYIRLVTSLLRLWNIEHQRNPHHKSRQDIVEHQCHDWASLDVIRDVNEDAFEYLPEPTSLPQSARSRARRKTKKSGPPDPKIFPLPLSAIPPPQIVAELSATRPWYRYLAEPDLDWRAPQCSEAELRKLWERHQRICELANRPAPPIGNPVSTCTTSSATNPASGSTVDLVTIPTTSTGLYNSSTQPSLPSAKAGGSLRPAFNYAATHIESSVPATVPSAAPTTIPTTINGMYDGSTQFDHATTVSQSTAIVTDNVTAGSDYSSVGSSPTLFAASLARDSIPAFTTPSTIPNYDSATTGAASLATQIGSCTISEQISHDYAVNGTPRLHASPTTTSPYNGVSAIPTARPPTHFASDLASTADRCNGPTRASSSCIGDTMAQRKAYPATASPSESAPAYIDSSVPSTIARLASTVGSYEGLSQFNGAPTVDSTINHYTRPTSVSMASSNTSFAVSPVAPVRRSTSFDQPSHSCRITTADTYDYSTQNNEPLSVDTATPAGLGGALPQLNGASAATSITPADAGNNYTPRSGHDEMQWSSRSQADEQPLTARRQMFVATSAGHVRLPPLPPMDQWPPEAVSFCLEYLANLRYDRAIFDDLPVLPSPWDTCL